MPVTVKPREKPALKNPVRTSGTQKQFQTAGYALAEALGWYGDPEHEGNGVSVQDAWNFIVKTLHENFIAGALGHERPDPLKACEHLGLTDEADLKLVAEATRKAFEDGAGGSIEEIEGKVATAGAALIQKGTVG